MFSDDKAISIGVFGTTIAIAFAFSVLGRVRDKKSGSEAISGQKLNRWLVGLSAGATANSGFVVTGAVGLGYSYGLHWVMLPLAWLLGDLFYWQFFPKRINRLGQEVGATTIADLITANVAGKALSFLRPAISAVILICLGFYTSAQWLAGEKFVGGAFNLPPLVALGLFAAIIVSYTAIGGFRGSVLTDSYQAVLRLIGTTIAIVMVMIVANQQRGPFFVNIDHTNDGFLELFPGSSVLAVFAFVLGYAVAALGFGLGQPQVLTRYMAAESPQETQAAKWIYIFFVQYTWIAMTLFGVILRGVMPTLTDGETGLPTFFSTYMPPILTGIIIADIFATIAATSNSLIVAMAQSVKHDFLESLIPSSYSSRSLAVPAIVIGIVTMILSVIVKGNVVTLALSSVSVMGAGLAPAVIVRVLRWNFSGPSLLASIILGFLTAVAWMSFKLDGIINEALPGIFIGLLANMAVAKVTISKDHGSRPLQKPTFKKSI